MIKPTSHVLSRLALTGVVSLAVMTGLLALRLLQGPLSIGILTPFVERAMDEALGEYHAHIEDTVLRWSRDEGRIDLSFVGVTLRDKARRAVLAIPQMEIGFSAKALSRGLVAPSEVQFIGPSATIMRTSDGRIQLGFQAPGDDRPDIQTDELVRKIISELRSPKADGRLGFLERFYIREAGLTLYDSVTKSIWRAPNSLVALTRDGDDLTLRLDAKVEAGAGAFDLAATGRLPADSNDVETTIHLNGLRLSKLAEGTNGLEPFAGVDVPVHGDATVQIGLDGTIERASFWLFANSGHVVVPGLPSVSLDLKAAEAKGAFDAATDQIKLERLAYDAGTNHGFAVGTARLERSPQGTITGLGLDLEADGIALDMPDLFSARGRLDHVAFKGGIDLERNRLTIDAASLKMGEAVLEIAGTIDDRPEGVGAKITGSIAHLAVTDFAKLWPIGPARGARDWITENIHAGEITRGALRIAAAPGELSIAPIPDEVLDLSFEFSGLDVTYLHGLTPLTHAQGHARLTGNRFELAMTSGKIGALSADSGHFACQDIETHGAPGAIDVELSGEARELLTVLDMKPLEYPSRFGIDPSTVGGAVKGSLSIVLPLRRAVQFSDIVLNVSAKTDGLSLPPVYRDFDLTDGALAFTITNDALAAKGSVKLGGYAAKVRWRESFLDRVAGVDPTQMSVSLTLDKAGRARAVRPLDTYVKGLTPLRVDIKGAGQDVRQLSLDADLTSAVVAIPEFDWRKARGEAGRLMFVLDFPASGEHAFNKIVLDAPQLSIKGSAVLDAQGDLKHVAFAPFRIGAQTDAKLVMDQPAKKDGAADLEVSIEGRSFFAGQLIAGYKEEADHAAAEPPGAAAPTPGGQKFSAKLDVLTLANGAELTGFTGLYERRAGALRKFEASGTFASGAPLNILLSPAEKGARALLVESADAGMLLNGLDLTPNIEGGSMTLNLVLPPLDENGRSPAGAAPSGTLAMKDVRLINAPILTKVLSVGSFGGIRDMLNGEGLLFETVSLPFKVEGKTILVGSGRAYGPSVGLTIEGRVPRSEGDYDMSGTLVPAYTLNTLLGYVPLIGKIFTSREGEGLVGLTYHVRGDSADPHVMVNPLSALTPGFLRRIFQFGDKPKDSDGAEGSTR